MQASTNLERTPHRREGPRLLAVFAALVVAAAALLLTLALSSTMGPSNAAVQDKQPSNAAVQGKMPYTFFFTRPEMLGDPNNPTGVRYHSDGKLLAKAPNGSGGQNSTNSAFGSELIQ